MIALPLARRMNAVLGVGAFLKSTVCFIEADQAVLSTPIGDLDNPQDILGFEQTLAAFQTQMLRKPRLIAHDLHPDFYSTRWAQAQGLPTLAVQHHHAHIAAICAEHAICHPVIGLALDGFGLGPNNQSWGGELLWVDGPSFQRLGHLALMAQPGGDRAAREPWRMGAASLHRLGRAQEIAGRFAQQAQAVHLAEILSRAINCPLTSSAGRLFDAACGLLNIHPVALFEGQAPMALEAMVRQPKILTDGWTLHDGVLDFLPLLDALSHLDSAEVGADLFHGTLIAGLAQWAAQAAETHGIRHIAMGGGCFFNKILRQGLTDALEAQALYPLLPIKVSAGDPGVCLGQAWVAATSLERAE
ncbi:MAG TPA: hydrogenase maturation protein HypF [Rhodospirillaceae bacterium]|nr:hydrogenase maturation protein HypF [Rhodospirillaceae bacterium]